MLTHVFQEIWYELQDHEIIPMNLWVNEGRKKTFFVKELCFLTFFVHYKILKVLIKDTYFYHGEYEKIISFFFLIFLD